jgi:hypothetical protein
MSVLPASAIRSGARRLLAPSVVDVFFCALLFAVFLRPAGLQALLADGDTGWHIRTGELILATGRAPATDPFSFTAAGRPWFAWEWLSDVVFALLWRWRGLAAVAAFSGAAISLSAAILFSRVLERGVGLAVALGATMAAVSASSIHYLARPHVFSILFYGIVLWGLERDRARPGRAVWLLIPLTALWANLHAGFIAGCATVAALAFVRASGRDWAGARRYGLLTFACAAASLLNPYGWRLQAHVFEYLNSPWILTHVQEFQSPSIRSEGMVMYAVLLLGATLCAARADRFAAALTLLWGFASLRSARHAPFFALVAAPVIADVCAQLWARAADRLGPRSAAALLREFALDLGRRSRPGVWLIASAAFAITALPATGFPESRFPISAVERNMVRLAPSGACPRVLTSDQWADYLIYRLYPRQRVFFDGRSDFYGPRLGDDYSKLCAAGRGWRELLDRYGFEVALLPHDWPLSSMLEREPGWKRIYGDSVAVLYAREAKGRS